MKGTAPYYILQLITQRMQITASRCLPTLNTLSFSRSWIAQQKLCINNSIIQLSISFKISTNEGKPTITGEIYTICELLKLSKHARIFMVNLCVQCHKTRYFTKFIVCIARFPYLFTQMKYSGSTGPVANPASYATGTGSFPGVERPGRGVEHTPHLAPRFRKEQSYTSTPPLGLRGLFQGEF